MTERRDAAYWERNYAHAEEECTQERERADAAEARVKELEKAYKDAAGKLAGVRLIALSWEDDARNLNTVRTLPASTLMDCREQILTALGDDDAT